MKRPKFNDSLLEVKLDNEGFKTFNFVEELQKRVVAAQRMFVYVAAKELLNGLLSKIPKQDDYQGFRNNLKLSEVPMSRGSFGFCVHVDLRSKRVKKLDVCRTVIYVRQRKSRPTSQAIKALEDMGPWTPDTIPFWPTKREAIVIQRKVSKREADKIADRQKRQEQQVDRAMADAGRGRTNKKKDKESRPDRRKGRGKAIPDVSMLATSLEFGDSGKRPTPAWRTTLLEIMSTGMKSAPRRYRELKGVLGDPADKRWRKWPLVRDKISASKVKNYSGFMKRLGY